MKWQGESKEKLEISPRAKAQGEPELAAGAVGVPRMKQLISAPLLGQGVAAARLGHSCWVGMLQFQAAKECSPLSINLAFQQSQPLAVQNYSLVL